MWWRNCYWHYFRCERVKSFFYFGRDEVRDCSNTEQMSFVMPYVDKSCQIREEFIQFLECQSGTSAQKLYLKIVNVIRNLGLEISNLRGQGYDLWWSWWYFWPVFKELHNHNTRGSQQYLLNIPKTNTQMFGSNSIKIKSINDWNKMIHKIHFSSELLLKRNEFIKLVKNTIVT